MSDGGDWIGTIAGYVGVGLGTAAATYMASRAKNLRSAAAHHVPTGAPAEREPTGSFPGEREVMVEQTLLLRASLRRSNDANEMLHEELDKMATALKSERADHAKTKELAARYRQAAEEAKAEVRREEDSHRNTLRLLTDCQKSRQREQ